jgi:hypothetical protein
MEEYDLLLLQNNDLKELLESQQHHFKECQSERDDLQRMRSNFENEIERV